MAGTPTRTSRVVTPRSLTWPNRLAAMGVYGMIRALALTVRCRLDPASAGYERVKAGPVIFCIWHDRLALCLSLYRRYVTGPCPGRRMAALVSASRDGAFLAKILECYGIEPVRGSTSRRGPQALLELTTWGEQGFDLAITPDGPRGPRHVVQEGIMALAQLTGLPIVPAAYRLGWKWRLRSWDRFQVPLPLSRCLVTFAPPMSVPESATDAERERLRQALEQVMHEIAPD
ncbi:MAG TPA: lysophospholipid acyltransferase family protein [Candidatus Paceibacterota bacterium]|nr:lysophospholipid acyltransferase family protein [Verrucomicrobiota bacterium]HOX01072.1 lysophospholipid acyltransferase family protein [Verrucomicrobiota bacterium]HRZ43824.1 lysophospholipid acyltransferase family protein [Candidatus Paceibacterota bacterium]HRZ92628.1 lysophospholipid acyltransferase family protein [Candidatus Paceibacterota bacterium]